MAGGIREGYLLHLDAIADNVGDIRYVALEEGVIKFYAAPDRLEAHLMHTTSLTRHTVEVDIIPFNDGNGLPCRFVVHLTPYSDSSTSRDKEQFLLFSAPTSAATTLWMKALLNWHRHSFDTSVRSLPINAEDQAAIDAQRATDLQQLEERMQQYDLTPRPPQSHASSTSSIWSWMQSLMS
ncbi:hypothetical protein DYB37_010586 [Aphanomyces astaci]|uniref:PH domain-containing protein n=1 Tax=Aphanomyces astaci TaxID=112090 RepID=A0A3L6V298_APHAT|nr:hypothetical protein DYB35_009158 [Aphanomyces astaci]RHZ22140.1 hypothetical protein DYB37_010586 [Aphanomyces astaci]RLO02798.1 hypothetical protein DYB28_013714 [Aphanomyces astaci]